jgi:hypothetical protein
MRGHILPGTLCQFRNGWYLSHSSFAMALKSDIKGSMGQLLQLLTGTRELKATDPRDKIFSLFGILDEGIQPALAITQIMTENGETPGWLKVLRCGVTSLSNHVNNIDPNIDFGKPSALKPDYTKDNVSVYCDVTRFLIRRSPRTPDVLDNVQHNSDPATGTFSVLGSELVRAEVLFGARQWLLSGRPMR